MHIEELKKAILEELKQCADKDLLLDVLLKFYSQAHNLVKEEEVSYKNSQLAAVPESHYKLLREDWEKYKSGELEATLWEDFEKKLLKDLE